MARHLPKLEPLLRRGENKAIRTCDRPGCDQEGEHRAPRSREELNTYRWFCLDHVRQYNAAWNYYRGMTDIEVEADVRQDTVWHRPSWPLGVNGERLASIDCLADPFGLFEKPEQEIHRPPPSTPESQAMIVLNLQPPATVADVKARYKELVKRHHPDVNGGDAASEEKIRRINEAYATIMEHFAT